jgi:small subunit ribosomal protein S8
MALNDPLGDLFTRIRNAQMRSKSKVSTPGSRLRASVLEVLKNEGYIRGYSTTAHENGRTEFEIELKYFDGAPVIREISRVSKPGRRVYASVKALPRINNGLGIAIVSTPKGVMADHDARRQRRRRDFVHGVLGRGSKRRCLASARRRSRSPPASRRESRARPSR